MVTKVVFVRIENDGNLVCVYFVAVCFIRAEYIFYCCIPCDCDNMETSALMMIKMMG